MASKPIDTFLNPSIKLFQDNNKPFEDITAYRRLIGRLLYLNNTRLGNNLATQQLSQFLYCPSKVHYHAGCRVIRYLKGNPERGLMFPRTSTLQILEYSDADITSRVNSRRSTSDYYFFIDSSLVSWKAKKQQTIARSSSEAEYRALDSATCELIWLLYIWKDLQITCSKTPTCIATIKVPFIYHQIMCFMRGQSTLRLIVML